LYGLSFSGFYMAMLVVLLALILRPVGFKYRSKLPSKSWKQFWDYALFVGGFVPALIFGVAVGNVLQGVPFYFDDSLRAFYTGTFFGLLNPFALLCGLLSVTMLAMHGAVYLNLKTEGHLQRKAKKAAATTAILTVILFLVGGLWILYDVDGYALTSMLAHDGPSNPLHKIVVKKAEGWFVNYQHYPVLMTAPFIGVMGALLLPFFLRFAGFSFILSGLSLFGIIATVGVSMFPFILPSSTHPAHSLMVWDSSSSHLTLFIMLVATVIFLPIVLTYTAWVYRVLRGKVTTDTITQNTHTAY